MTNLQLIAIMKITMETITPQHQQIQKVKSLVEVVVDEVKIMLMN